LNARICETRPSELKVDFAGCPVHASMGVLGRKWALLVLRNIALYRKQRFNEMLRATPGLTRRVLSMRLRELERDGFIEVVERGKNYSRWELTEKGRDVLPVLMTLVRFGSKWYPDQVFEDKVPRQLKEVFDEMYIRRIMEPIVPNSAMQVPARIPKRATK
jgi:DNA-binding HxlR family transcriptional regulator